MKTLISGSTGFIGSELVRFLAEKGAQVARLVRSKRTGGAEVLWNPVARILDGRQLEGLDAVVHLAGEPVVRGRWTPEKKAQIRDSRVQGTRFLCESLAKLAQPPKTFVCASAIGLYGDRGEETLSEESPAGSGFLAEVAQEWEKACEPASQRGIRVANARIGVVLSPKGGALQFMLPAFRWGLGGVLGNGRQWMSWISLTDVVGAIHHLLETPSLRGPVNLVSPQPLTCRDLTRTLGRVLHRPTVFPVPGFAVRLLLGEMGKDLLLASSRVEPRRLKATGYRFKHPELEAALQDLLAGRSARRLSRPA